MSPSSLLDGPFVAVENSKMHRYARALVGVTPTQFVHPWQHGHGHTKPTALYLRNLPEIVPTQLEEGRLHALARLPPSADRSALRSRTYPGVAAAMATQWMPVLIDYLHHRVLGTRNCSAARRADKRSAADLVASAGRPLTEMVSVAFVRRTESLGWEATY